MPLMRIMMLMIPGFIRKKIKAGENHPTIKMNLDNLLTCMNSGLELEFIREK